MVYAYGVGEVPIVASAAGPAGGLRHTVRAVGAVTRALRAAPAGLAARAYADRSATGWDLTAADGADLVFVAGGIGLAPLRPVIRTALPTVAATAASRSLIGARTPADLLYPGEYGAWRGSDAEVLRDRGPCGRGLDGGTSAWSPRSSTWPRSRPAGTVAFVCGPEVMMRFAARDLVGRGVPPEAVQVSLERNMQCGVALCGHCQLGPLLVCRDGPVVGYPAAASLLEVSEL